MDAIVATASSAWKSDRLIYGAFDAKDTDLQTWLLENISNDPVVDALSAGNLLRPQTKQQAADYVDGLSKCLLTVTICLPAEQDASASETDDKKEKPKPKIIGYIGLSGAPPRMAHHRSAGIALCIMDEYQNKGYGGEAINWMVDWGFRHADLHRIGIGAISYNDRAIALYQKLGFVLEGRQRERILFDRKRYDLVDMSMLVHEWEALREKQRGEKSEER